MIAAVLGDAIFLQRSTNNFAVLIPEMGGEERCVPN